MLIIQYTFRRTWSATIQNGRFKTHIEGLPTKENTEASVIDLLRDMDGYGCGHKCYTVLSDIIDCLPDDAIQGMSFKQTQSEY